MELDKNFQKGFKIGMNFFCKRKKCLSTDAGLLGRNETQRKPTNCLQEKKLKQVETPTLIGKSSYYLLSYICPLIGRGIELDFLCARLVISLNFYLK